MSITTVKKSKKRRSGESSVPGGRISGLTAEDHLLRQMTLRFLVDQRMRIKEVARQLKTTVPKIKSFFDDQDFLNELKERVDSVLAIDDQWRLDQAKVSLHFMYEELRRREALEELKDVSTRDLHKMIINTQKELRLDTPGSFTSKMGVMDLGKLQGRFNNSLSGKASRLNKKKKKPKLLKRVAGLKDDTTLEDNFEGSS